MEPGTITALHVQANDSQRINLFIDQKFALGISLATLAREKLYVGQLLSKDDLCRLEQAEHADRALRAAVRAIEQRPRSIAELRDRLRRKGFEAEAIEQALERLQQLELLDDRDFARRWIENRQIFRPRGPAALRNELRRKGIDAALIDAALADQELLGDMMAQAEQSARAVLHRYLNAPDFNTFFRKLGGYLQRRGYDSEITRIIVKRLWHEKTARDEDEG